jgi:hypothetical protein
MPFAIRSRRIHLSVVAIFAAALGVPSFPVVAQEATPATAGEVVPPEECTTAPRPADFLADLIATPVAATPIAPITTLPAGTAPDEPTKSAIEAAVRQLVACSNTGDVLRGLALFTDDYLRRTLDPTGQLTAEAAIALIAPYATPIPLAPAQLVRLVEVRDITLLPDGRVAAVSVTDGGIPDPPGVTVDLLVFVKAGDRWLIDETVANVDQPEEATATAAP